MLGSFRGKVTHESVACGANFFIEESRHCEAVWYGTDLFEPGMSLQLELINVW